MPEIMFSAGEVSGDRHAALLAGKLREMHSGLRFWGLGGDELAGAGAEIICHTVSESVMGFTEPLKKINFYLSLLAKMKSEIKKRKPDLMVLVDFTAFNMRLARCGYEEGIPVVSYFSPSAWAWGGWRAAKMAAWQVKIAAVWPMEYQAYQRAGAQVSFVGHPLPHLIKNKPGLTAGPEFLRDGHHNFRVGLLPGSRELEIKKLLPEFLRAARMIHGRYNGCLFVLPLAAPHLRGTVEKIVRGCRGDSPLLIVDGSSLEVINGCRLIITAGGTATLEAACLGVPMLAAYKTSLPTALLARLLARVKYFALPNLILGEQVVPEFFQGRASGRLLGQAALNLLEDRAGLEKMKARLAEAASCLGDDRSLERAAVLVLETIKGRGA